MEKAPRVAWGQHGDSMGAAWGIAWGQHGDSMGAAWG